MKIGPVKIAFVGLAAVAGLLLYSGSSVAQTPKPKRINRAIELLEQGQPIYYSGVEDRSFEGGVAASKTWADYLNFEMQLLLKQNAIQIMKLALIKY